MAQKKKQEEFKPISMPIPNGERTYTIRRSQFNGVNYANIVNSNALSKCKNISTEEAPLLVPSMAWTDLGQITQPLEGSNVESVLSMQVIGDYVYVFFTRQPSVGSKLDVCCKVMYANDPDPSDTGEADKNFIITITEGADDTTSPRYIADFNRSDAADMDSLGKFDRTLIVVPDMKKIEYTIVTLDNDTKYKYVDGGGLEPTTNTTGYYKFSSFDDVIALCNGTYKNEANETQPAVTLNTKAFYRFIKWHDRSNNGGRTRFEHYRIVATTNTATNTVNYSKEEIGTTGVSWSIDEFGAFEAYDINVETKGFNPSPDEYFLTTDTKCNPLKTYYELNSIRTEDTVTYKYVKCDRNYVVTSANTTFYYRTIKNGAWDGVWNEETLEVGQRINVDSIKYYTKTAVTVSGTTSDSFVVVSGLTKGQDISKEKYYEKRNDLPTEDCSKDEYWTNYETGNTYVWYDDTDDYGNVMGWQLTVTPTAPMLDYATAHLSRLFGISNGMVWASAFNEPTNWVLDPQTASNAETAWRTVTNTNTRYSSEFTGIIPYNGSLIIFKEDCIQEVTGSKKPFTIQDIYTEGCVSQDTIQIVNGTLFFLSHNGVMAYTGYKPKRVGDRLDIKRFNGVYSSCNDGRVYYLYYEKGNDKRLFTYDTWYDSWCEESVPYPVISMGWNPNCKGVLMICDKYENATHKYILYQRSTQNHSTDWSCETDIINTVTSNRRSTPTYNVKRMKHMQVAYEVPKYNKNNYCRMYLLKDHEEFDEDESILLCDLDCSQGFHVEDKVLRGGAMRDFRIHIEGNGYIKIENIQFTMAYGGEVTDE